MEDKIKFLKTRDEFIALSNYNNEYNIFNKDFDFETGLWRYMDFSKFVNLLDTKSIFFTKPSKFRDPYEGAFSEQDFIRIIGEPVSYIPDIKYDYDQRRESLIKESRILLDFVGVSCWHLNNTESAAMWDLYLRSGEGIAIKSNIVKLIDSLHSLVSFGQVQYIDYFKDMASNNTYESLFYKRSSFSHENEFRIIHFEDIDNPCFQEYGALLSCDLNHLIEEIYVAPTAPQWFVQTVASVVKMYKIDKPIKQSSLYNSQSNVF
ncbi:hypothetical protein ACQCVB_20330 [Fictibacillus phosphorivorans]|uniref:hypothetical protein n=1 Tax=Fictibacillus phosphorivorans TaxID=1221500 RepID=UPI003CF6C676